MLWVSHARLLNLNQNELVQCSNKSNNTSGHYILLAMPKGLVCTLIGPNMGLCMRLYQGENVLSEFLPPLTFLEVQKVCQLKLHIHKVHSVLPT